MVTSNTRPSSRRQSTGQARRWLEGSALGIVTVGLATLPKWLFSYSIGRPTPFILYFLPVLFATFRGGWVAGVFTTCIASAASGLFFVIEMDAIWADTLPRVFIFGAQALVFVFLIDRFARERQRSRQLIKDVSETRDRLNGILLGTADGITVHDTDGRCIFANDSAAQLLELDSTQAVIGTSQPQIATGFELYDVERKPYTMNNSPSQLALRTGQPAEDIMGFRSMRNLDTPIRWSRVRANPILSEDGSVSSVVTLFYDVTETRRREEALALAQEWFQIALKSIGDAVITTDEHGHVNMANRVAEVLLGKAAIELHHRPVRDVFQVVDETCHDAIPDPVEQVLRSGVAFQVTNPAQLRRADGKDIPVDSSAAPIRDRDGNLRGVILVFRDVSAQRTRERQQAFLSRVTEELNSSFDYRATLQAVAHTCVPLLGDWCVIDLQEGTNLDRVVSAYGNPDNQNLHAEIAKIRSNRTDSAPRSVFSERLISIPLAKGAKHLGVLSLALSDSTRTYTLDDQALAANLADRIAVAVENARLFEATNVAREQAIAADRTKSDFLAMLGHELRNPLAPIQTALEVLRLNDDHSTDTAEFQIIDRQLRHLVRLVDDLLDISRITHGRVELNREVVDVLTVIEQACETVCPAGAKPSHDIHVDAPAGLRVMGDPIRLAQVLTNLLINACKYSAPGSQIWIGAAKRDSSAVVTIRDEGIGIEPEMLQKVFDTFVQEPQALDRSRGGLGLGLSIVQGLVNAHGGQVSAHSAGIGKGSTFEVRLPVLANSPDLALAASKVSPRSAVKRRVLVVDDNVDAAEVMAKLLRKFGHTVFTAYTPSEAIDTVSRETLDIALLDIGLPQMSGYELARRLRTMKSGESLPFVAITGYGQLDDRSRSLREGFVGHLVKPVMLEDLHSTLDSLG
jgi:PAS domain S-box-containing protein